MRGLRLQSNTAAAGGRQAGRQAGEASGLVRKSLAYFGGRSNTGEDLQIIEDIESPFLEMFWFEVKVNKIIIIIMSRFPKADSTAIQEIPSFSS